MKLLVKWNKNCSEIDDIRPT